MRITIDQTEGRGCTVTVDGKRADELAPDETLGVVASALFGNTKPRYVRDSAELPQFPSGIDLLRVS